MRLKFTIIFLFSITFVFSNKTPSEIYHDLQKLHSLKRVLYIAAHPDDENTKALAYFSLGEKAETAYLSLTRGDGGQNLIGKELSEDLGVLRTQELLAARTFDGAKQFFTRAVDFGYSKSAEESFNKWGKAEILSDVVLIIRQFKPDAIITRFPPDKRAGHGHHTASALLAIEAFEKAADPNYLPEQVKKYGIWQSGSVYWNSSVWWNKKLGEEAKNNSDFITQDIGGYDNLLGMSYNEIGTLARSEHKCQGFGAIIERGSRIEYFKHLAGNQLKESFFESNTATWDVLLGNTFDMQFQKLLTSFDFINIENNIPDLLKILKGLQLINDDYIKAEKIKKCQDIILECLGIYIEVVGDDYAYQELINIPFKLNIINRSSLNVSIEKHIEKSDKFELVNLKRNELYSQDIIYRSQPYSYSNPYWLNGPFVNLFTNINPSLLGKAIGPSSMVNNIILIVEGTSISIPISHSYKWRDPSYGERKRPVISTPSFTVNFDQKIVLAKPNESQKVRMKVHSYKDDLTDKLIVKVPKGWVTSDSIIPIRIENKHNEKWIEFTLNSSVGAARGLLELVDQKGNSIVSMIEISYDHIPTQTIFKQSKLDCIQIDAKIKEGRIAYVKGVDDVVPQAIELLGFEVDVFEVSQLPQINLSVYQTVVLGIRIYNVHPELKQFDDKLNNYVFEGGNLIMQYNTASRSIKGLKFGPKPFELSRNRVTEEDAKVTFLKPDHSIMQTPNIITEKDFENWVQERGLYFAQNWDESYQPLFAWHDVDEMPQEGALVVSNYGKGRFVYTGISFFRELPKGVEGAYRLFANLLSY